MDKYKYSQNNHWIILTLASIKIEYSGEVNSNQISILGSRVWSGIFLVTKQESLQAIQKDLLCKTGSNLPFIFVRNMPKGKLNRFSQNDMQATQLSPIIWAWHNQMEQLEYMQIDFSRNATYASYIFLKLLPHFPTVVLNWGYKIKGYHHLDRKGENVLSESLRGCCSGSKSLRHGD